MPENEFVAVLGGGGSGGCFQAGALHCLFDKIKFKSLYGTSVGALNAIILAQAYLEKKPDVLKRIWTKIIDKNNKVYSKKYWNLIVGNPPYDFSPLKKIIEKELYLGEIHKGDVEIMITSIDLVTGNKIFVSNKTHDFESFKNYLFASFCVPPLFDPIVIGERILVDGGVRENVPMAKAIEDGEHNLFVFLCNPFFSKSQKEQYGNVISISSRCIDLMMKEIGDNDIKLALGINDLLDNINGDQKKNIQFLKDKIKLDRIEIFSPRRKIVSSFLEFNQTELKDGFEHGFGVANDWLLKNPEFSGD